MAVPWNITEFQAQFAGAVGPNRSLQVGLIEPTSHGHSSPTGVRLPPLLEARER